MAGRGRLLALEGIDGCGKSTQARALAKALGALLTREPGATDLGTHIRELLLSPDVLSVPSPRAEALLMVADRAEHVHQVLEPALAAGQWVVTDRYAGSTIAYQGYGRGLDVTALRDLIDWATEGMAADLSILVDVPVEVAAARLAAGQGGDDRGDRMERLGPAFAERVREGFHAQADADPDHWVVVDGEATASDVTAFIVASVRTRFPDAPGSDR
jgi:dTMP kinase